LAAVFSGTTNVIVPFEKLIVRVADAMNIQAAGRGDCDITLAGLLDEDDEHSRTSIGTGA
jgi:hypothetical protein